MSKIIALPWRPRFSARAVKRSDMRCIMCCICPGLQRFPLIRLLVLGFLIAIILPRGALMAQSHAPVRAPEFPRFQLGSDKARSGQARFLIAPV